VKESRPPYFAGFFYPEAPALLQSEIEKMLERGKSAESFSSINALIVPHAGYAYSGVTAAYAYTLVKQKSFSTVVILSPSHQEYFPGICVYDGAAYDTPLGTVPVNRDVCEKLVGNSKRIYMGKQGHNREHAIEVQLPFLQSVLKDFSIVPVVMGDQNTNFIDDLAEHLPEILDEQTLLVVSSDLSHYHTQKKAVMMDERIAGRIENWDVTGLANDLRNGKSEACGGGLLIAAIKALTNKAAAAKVLHRTTSGEVTLDFDQVVGYLSAVVYN